MSRPNFRLTRRGVQISLGILWLIDGMLQLQPQMFTNNFANHVIAPASQGQPGFVSSLIHLGIRLLLLHPAIFNALFALTQLSIGILILVKRTAKTGLILSITWGLIVWSVGEGFGGIFSAHTILLMGAPGAALIYALLSLAVLPRAKKIHKPARNLNAAYWLALVWLVIWVGGGIYQLLPGQNSVSNFSTMISQNASGAPAWLSTVDKYVSKNIEGLGSSNQLSQTSNPSSSMSMSMPISFTQNSGYIFILLLAAFQIFIGFGVLFRGILRKTAVASGIVLALVFWVIGQSLGNYYSGLATDLNSGPLFVILGLAILSCTNLDNKLSILGSRIEQLFIGNPELNTQLETIEPSPAEQEANIISD